MVYIAPEEMSHAIVKVVRESIAIQPEVAVPLIARIFGFNRITEEMKKDLLTILEHNVNTGKIKKVGDLLKES